METIKLYIEIWNTVKGVKPVNDPEFIAAFTKFAKSAPIDNWEFEGNNNYCGYTARVYEHATCLPEPGTGFEFSYNGTPSKDFVIVFTGKHCGFWVPEYIHLAGTDARELLDIIKHKYLEWGGF